MILLRKFLHLLIFLDLICAALLFVLACRTSFSKGNEYLDRRGRFFSLRRPLPSNFSEEYYSSYRQSALLGAGFLAAWGLGALLFWIDRLIFA